MLSQCLALAPCSPRGGSPSKTSNSSPLRSDSPQLSGPVAVCTSTTHFARPFNLVAFVTPPSFRLYHWRVRAATTTTATTAAATGKPDVRNEHHDYWHRLRRCVPKPSVTRRSRSFCCLSKAEAHLGPTQHPRAGVYSVRPSLLPGLVHSVGEGEHSEEARRGRRRRLDKRAAPGVRSGKRTRAHRGQGQTCSVRNNLQQVLVHSAARASSGRTSQQPERSALRQVRIHVC